MPAILSPVPHILAIGDPEIDAASVRLGQHRKRVLLTTNGVTRPVGTTSEVLSLEKDRAGAVSLRRLQSLDSRELGMLRVEVLMSPATLAPLSAQSAGLLGGSALSYRDGAVRGTITEADGSRIAVDQPLEHPVFDAYAVEVLLRALPLDHGYAVDVPAYVHRARAVVPVAVRVDALDEHSDERAWRVAVDFGRLRSTYWIGSQSRALLRQDTLLTNGGTLSFVG